MSSLIKSSVIYYLSGIGTGNFRGKRLKIQTKLHTEITHKSERVRVISSIADFKEKYLKFQYTRGIRFITK